MTRLPLSQLLTMTNIYRNGKVHIRARECENCLFSPNRIVSGSRAADIVKQTKDTSGASFICHKDQVDKEPTAICRGWWDRFYDRDPTVRLAVALDIVEEVSVIDP